MRPSPDLWPFELKIGTPVTLCLFVFELAARAGNGERQTDGRTNEQDPQCSLLGWPHNNSANVVSSLSSCFVCTESFTCRSDVTAVSILAAWLIIALYSHCTQLHVFVDAALITYHQQWRRPPGACAALVKWTGWTLAVEVPRWQHHKHCRGCCCYYYDVALRIAPVCLSVCLSVSHVRFALNNFDCPSFQGQTPED